MFAQKLSAKIEIQKIDSCLLLPLQSHYCYQKHKRRHINPFTVDFQKAAPGNFVKQGSGTVKDINVQVLGAGNRSQSFRQTVDSSLIKQLS
jgi:hypothetical protein